MVGLFRPYEPRQLTFLSPHGRRTSQPSRTVPLRRQGSLACCFADMNGRQISGSHCGARNIGFWVIYAALQRPPSCLIEAIGQTGL